MGSNNKKYEWEIMQPVGKIEVMNPLDPNGPTRWYDYVKVIYEFDIHFYVTNETYKTRWYSMHKNYAEPLVIVDKMVKQVVQF